MTSVEDGTKPFRVLSLDGGGAKGFYTLGVLKEIEALVGCKLHEKFDLIFGTSTGSIIAALLALGKSVDEIHELYCRNVPKIMKKRKASQKTAALEELAQNVFGDAKFGDVKTGIGIVTTKWMIEEPMIFKGSIAQAHGRQPSFSPGFGCTIADAVVASCSAYPFFGKKVVVTDQKQMFELIDGGYCANNPTLYAIADALVAMKQVRENVRVISIGVGSYPPTKPPMYRKSFWTKRLPSVQLLQKTLDINTKSMERLSWVLFKDVPMIRVSDAFQQPEMATDLFEHNLAKLNALRNRGVNSYAAVEQRMKEFLL